MIVPIPPHAIWAAPLDDRNWVVVAEYVYVTTLIKPGTRIVVPAGFVTDGASVPRYLWQAIPPFGLHFTAAVVHDWLYRHRPHQLSKGLADAVFSEIMARDGVPEARQIVMREAVERWGHGAYYLDKHAPIMAADAPQPEEADHGH